MKINKKTIISNTLLFIGIMTFIFAFMAFFGSENILIGISTITAMLMFLERDLTIYPVANTLKLIFLNLFIGIAAYLAGLNIWAGIPINFIAMFVISYLLIFNLKNPLYLPFSLQYIFLLVMPVSIGQMPLRLTALVFGAIAIMALQLLFNRKRVKKTGDKKIKAISGSLLTKIKQIKKGEDHTSLDEQITADISSLRSIIYDRREEDFYLTKEGQIKLNISASLEKINLMLTTIPEEEADSEILDDLYVSLSIVSEDNTENLDTSFSEALSKYKHRQVHSLFVLRVLNNIDFLKENVIELKNLDTSHYNVVEKMEEIPNKFRKLTFGNAPRHTTSIKFSYAFRAALAISISDFITVAFGLDEGRWILFTVLSVIAPIYEQSREKMQDRIFATIVGVVIVGILFTIFQGDMARSILLITAGYLMNYVKAYRYTIIFVTFSAIGAATLITGPAEFLTVERIVLVVFGVILALLINKFVFPYKKEDANQDLENMYDDTISSMLEELSAKFKSKASGQSMKNLLIITSMIEDRLKLNNQKQHKDWLYRYRMTASTVYELYDWMETRGIPRDMLPNSSKYIRKLLNIHESKRTDDKLVSDLKEQIHDAANTEKRLVWSMILDLTVEIQTATQMRQSKDMNTSTNVDS